MSSQEKVVKIYEEAIMRLVEDVEVTDPMVLPVSVQHMKEEVLKKTIKQVSEMIYGLVNVDKVDPAQVMFILAATTSKVLTENFGVMYGRLKELPDQQYVQMFNSWLGETDEN